MDRREFLNTAVAGAGLALLPGAVLPGASSPEGKLHVALIGYTNISGHRNTATTCVAWNDLVRRGFLKEKDPPHGLSGQVIDSRPSRPPLDYELPGGFNKPPHQPHLENFFAAIRGEATLNCDARCAFASEAPMHRVDSSARTHQAITFAEED